MFTLALQRSFSAKHALIGGDWGAENEVHSHDYRLELRLEGEKLNHHGYLIDLLELEHQLDDLLGSYKGALLNELPEFEGLNPSLERFARNLCGALAVRLNAPNLCAMRVQLWESDLAWASYRLEL
jgi:6-pyruvoyltetrahydropterin/6-carboxytetrahydropterin synthase